MGIEERVIEEKAGGVVEKFRGIGPLGRQGAIGAEKLPDCEGGFSGGDGAFWQRVEKRGNAIDDLMAGGAKLIRRHGQRRFRLRGDFDLLHGAASKRILLDRWCAGIPDSCLAFEPPARFLAMGANEI